MKVNIVCRDLIEDKVLPRLARILANGTGWSLGEHPVKGVDLNYWMIYIDLAERHSDWRATPAAAYFSHYEAQTSFKRTWWDMAAGLVRGAMLTSAQYTFNLPVRLPKAIARPPVDLKLFQPSDEWATSHQPHKKLIGVSGFVDRSGRKGEQLVSRLALDYPSQVIACGSGWPVPCKLYPFSKLPDFYQSLSVFVCTASTEGIPMPPLEALACGIPIVIPRGVGMLDELPDIRGIRRYAVGDYEELKLCIDLTLHDAGQIEDADQQREGLRAVAETYTPSVWCDDHKKAFESFLATEPIVTAEVESDRHGLRGVFYVAYGEPARRCAEGAIQSFKQHMPNVPVALASTKPIGPEDIFIQNADEDIGGRSVKTKIWDLAPREWQYVMYLDADTELVADISFLYQVLEDGWDMVICKNPGKYHTIRYMARSDNADECARTFDITGTDQILQLNGGVFAFQRNARTEAFFTAWHNEWLKWGKRDQAALIRSMFANPLKLYVLTNAWNTITRYASPSTSAGILHYPMTARRWRGILHGRLDDEQAWRTARDFEEKQNVQS